MTPVKQRMISWLKRNIEHIPNEPSIRKETRDRFLELKKKLPSHIRKNTEQLHKAQIAILKQIKSEQLKAEKKKLWLEARKYEYDIGTRYTTINKLKQFLDNPTYKFPKTKNKKYYKVYYTLLGFQKKQGTDEKIKYSKEQAEKRKNKKTKETIKYMEAKPRIEEGEHYTFEIEGDVYQELRSGKGSWSITHTNIDIPKLISKGETFRHYENDS